MILPFNILELHLGSLNVQKQGRCWMDGIPRKSRGSLIIALIIMEISSPREWRDAFFYKAKIYEYPEDGTQTAFILEEDPRVWEYLHQLHGCAIEANTTGDVYVHNLKCIIVGNISERWARKKLISCPEKLKKWVNPPERSALPTRIMNVAAGTF